MQPVYQQASQGVDDVKSAVNIERPLIEGPLNEADLSYQQLKKAGYESFDRPVLASQLRNDFEEEKIDPFKEFERLYQTTFTEGHQKNIFKDQYCEVLNRYSDILVYKNSRVVLQQRPGHHISDTYINACFLGSPFD